MAAGPSGVNPQIQLNQQINAAQQFVGTTGVSKGEATGKKEGKKELSSETPMNLEDKPELSSLTEQASKDSTLELLESALQQQQQAKQAQAELFQTGFAGAKGRESSRRIKEGEAKPPNEEQTAELMDQTGDAEMDAQRSHRLSRSKSRTQSTDIAGVLSDAPEEEEKIQGALSGAAGFTPVVEVATSIDQDKIDALKLKATYNFATREAQYTPPVNTRAVDEIFAAENANAAAALPAVKNLELTPIAPHVDPILEPRGYYRPIVQFEESGLHGGQVQYGS